jgi:GAF domain-containing protein
MKKASKTPKAPERQPAPGEVRRIKVGWAAPTKFVVPIPHNEPERIASLRSFKILDTPPEEAFDELTQLAALICQAPIAMISLVDSERQWFKAKVGTAATGTPREIAFCAHAIMEEDLFIVDDATADTRFANNPMVTSDPKIRFYAGAPLLTADRFALGTLCVVDRVPRKLDENQKRALRLLGRQVIKLLELRRELLRLKPAH